MLEHLFLSLTSNGVEQAPMSYLKMPESIRVWSLPPRTSKG